MESLYIIVFTKIASTEGFILSAILILIFLLAKNSKLDAILFFMSTVFFMTSVHLMKVSLSVPRPPEPLIEITGYALPSGHAAGSAFLALTVVYLTRYFSNPLRYSLWVVLIFITLLIGVSRVHLGVHTPFQVGIGFLIGILWVLVFIILKKFYRYHYNSCHSTFR